MLDVAAMTDVRLPAVLQSYGCGRTLLCCHAPFRAHITDADQARIAPILDPSLSARLSAATGPLAGGTRRLEQPKGSCGMLDAPACSLHAAVGLAALPSNCRNYPRSVVRSPDGVEVAFMLSCPTAAGMVVAAPAAFAWTTWDGLWPWPADRRAAHSFQLSSERRISWPELVELRAHWWARLSDPGQLRETLTELAPRLDLWSPSLNEALVGMVLSAAHRRGQDVAALQLALAEPKAVRLDQPDVLACAAGLAVQLACGHVVAPIDYALAMVARQIVLSARLGMFMELSHGLSIAAEIGASGFPPDGFLLA